MSMSSGVVGGRGNSLNAPCTRELLKDAGGKLRTSVGRNCRRDTVVLYPTKREAVDD